MSAELLTEFHAVTLPHHPSPEFLEDVRRVLKGSGFHLWQRGRGPRKAAALAVYGPNCRAAFYQSLPLRYASKVTIYVRENKGSARRRHEAMKNDNWQYVSQRAAVEAARAAGMVKAVARIWWIHGKEP